MGECRLPDSRSLSKAWRKCNEMHRSASQECCHSQVCLCLWVWRQEMGQTAWSLTIYLQQTHIVGCKAAICPENRCLLLEANVNFWWGRQRKFQLVVDQLRPEWCSAVCKTAWTDRKLQLFATQSEEVPAGCESSVSPQRDSGHLHLKVSIRVKCFVLQGLGRHHWLFGLSRVKFWSRPLHPG